MADRHRYNPVRLRTADQEWLEARAAATGTTVPDLLAAIIARERTRTEEAHDEDS